jgi:hypothetical protein
MKKFSIPLGMLSEEGAEGRNKFYKYDRQHHSRLDSREHTMQDVFCRHLVSSDPVISEIGNDVRRKYLKRHQISEEVKNMLRDQIEENENENGAVIFDEAFEEFFQMFVKRFYYQNTKKIKANKKTKKKLF